MHRIAIAQWRGAGAGRAFIQAGMANGKTKTAALRLSDDACPPKFSAESSSMNAT